MDTLPITLGIIIILLICTLIYLLIQPKTQPQNPQLENNLNQALKNQEELISQQSLKNTEQIDRALKNQEKLLKIRLENLSKELQTSSTTLTQINTVLLAPMKRDRLGNTQLDQLLSLYLPKNDKVYQLEYRLKKTTGKGGFLIVDAIIFGIDGKNNIAIDSKLPLENFLLLHQENLSDLEKKVIEKNFKNNLKDHIKKVAEYVSELDGTEHAVMFIPSEAVFAKINEHGYYEIMEFALEKKVSLCSPVTLALLSIKSFELPKPMNNIVVWIKFC